MRFSYATVYCKNSQITKQKHCRNLALSFADNAVSKIFLFQESSTLDALSFFSLLPQQNIPLYEYCVRAYPKSKVNFMYGLA